MTSKRALTLLLMGTFFTIITSCTKDNAGRTTTNESTSVLKEYFGNAIDINTPHNYASQPVPSYITKDNTSGNVITDAGATLGRVLFYDKKLSSNNSISCGSCHIQAFGFTDTAHVSQGVNGTTARHGMRLVNSRFAEEARFFWDKRATNLEVQTTQPIKDHNEMGYSGTNGDAGIAQLISKLEALEYYPILFENAFGEGVITEDRMQLALAQFIRSIQSFDSKYDKGRADAPNDGAPFLNFSAEENQGKNLFLAAPQFDNNGSRTGGGLGCGGCHRAPEFDIDPNSLNNGNIGSPDGSGPDLFVTRSPTLRDVLKSNGAANGPFMHIGASSNFNTVLNHYNEINTVGNNNIDPRLTPGGQPQRLNITLAERQAVIAFVSTLAGSNVYSDSKWTDPFLP